MWAGVGRSGQGWAEFVGEKWEVSMLADVATCRRFVGGLSVLPTSRTNLEVGEAVLAGGEVAVVPIQHVGIPVSQFV